MIDPKFGSHLPILTRLIDLTDEPILELGMGLWSTPMLDLMCKKTERGIASYDNDKKWFDENAKWRSSYHSVEFVEDWENINITNRHWSIVLIDHRPGHRRHKEALRLAHNADFILLHDSEPSQEHWTRYSKIYPLFKYKYVYDKCLPNTTVLSNTVDIKKFLT